MSYHANVTMVVHLVENIMPRIGLPALASSCGLSAKTQLRKSDL